MAEGVAADDGAALHYVDGRLLRAVSSRPRAQAWGVRKSGERAVENRLPGRYLGARKLSAKP
jgi:hypothetical protein